MSNEITFFMLVTERDCMIANYAIKSYEKIYDQRDRPGYRNFVLFIYLNCLSEESKRQYCKIWGKYPYVNLFDNSEKISGSTSPYPGETIISPEGLKRERDDFAESYDELWTTELKKFATPFIATVDADFEILNADFFFYLMQELDRDPQIIGASSSFSHTQKLFDTYSKREILLSERNHTWFCIYRKEAFILSKVSQFYFEERKVDGQLVCYDSAAFFQKDLKERCGKKFITLPAEYTSSFVHYGAGSKNKSLNRKNIRRYRRAFILANSGIIYGREKTGLVKMINKLARNIGFRLYGKYLRSVAIERTRYINDEQAT